MDGQSQHHRQFTLERLYPNCRAHTWSAWSIPEKKAAWLGSARLEMDFSVGGIERSGFRDSMGEHVSEGRYFEIKEGERIVFAYSMAVNGRVHTVSLASILFKDEGGGTRLTYTEQMCVIPPSDGAEGREHGWGALLDGLAGFLAADVSRVRMK
ncbi:SRPBCC domain-containing protein [Pseudorhizobium flavum]|uniref:SRPBCC domain-containing protein n=1 Tax=Pseudorhizobium flavum TaxID=1335061 RepID=UPI00376FA610